MNIQTLLVLLVAFLHLYFMVLEMFLWTKPQGMKIFRNTLEHAKATKTLAANQGLYNGFLFAGLTWGSFHPNAETGFQIQIFFLACVMIAGIYGAATASRKILYIQALPALVALVFVMMARL